VRRTKSKNETSVASAGLISGSNADARNVDLPALVAVTHIAGECSFRGVSKLISVFKVQTAVETELLGTAEPGLQARSTSDLTETLTCVGSDTPTAARAMRPKRPIATSVPQDGSSLSSFRTM
jgi:hypothetical protein